MSHGNVTRHSSLIRLSSGREAQAVAKHPTVPEASPTTENFSGPKHHGGSLSPPLNDRQCDCSLSKVFDSVPYLQEPRKG